MPKPGQVAGARDIRKVERQRERHAKREEKLAKRREQRAQYAQAEARSKGKGVGSQE